MAGDQYTPLTAKLMEHLPKFKVTVTVIPGTYKYREVTIFLSQTFSQPGFKGISFLQFLIVARIRSFGKLIDLEKEVVV